MPRPIEELNVHLYLLCRNEGTFSNIPNLRDNNIWHATHAQLSKAVHEALTTTQTFNANWIMARRITFFEALQQKVSNGNSDATHKAINSDYMKTISAKNCQVCWEGAEIHFPKCDCAFCFECFRNTVRHGLSDEEYFPPTCCTDRIMNVNDIVHTLRPALVHLYEQFIQEFPIPAHLKVYCADPQCAAVIGRVDGLEQKHKCSHCDLRTCLTCFDKDHPGEPCMPVERVEDTWAMMDDTESVNCPKCGDVRAHGGGCNQMRCPRCHCDFCFLCGFQLSLGSYCDCDSSDNEDEDEAFRVPMKFRAGVKPPQFKEIRAKRDQRVQNVESFLPVLREGVSVINDPEIMQNMKDLGLYWVPAEYVTQ